jgi:hypothetical protein
MKTLTLKSKIALAFGVIALFITATAFTGATGFARTGPQDFILHNKTGVLINALYVSPHSADDWEEDVLGQDTLANGESVKITFDDRDKHVHWDLKVEDSKGNSLEWEDLNLIEISEVTLHWDAKKGKGWADLK